MFSSHHRSYILRLYKQILVEASSFFDDRTRTFIVNRARKGFKQYKDCQDIPRLKNQISNTRKKLHMIENANAGNQKAALKILEAAYGVRGKVRHRLLYPYLHRNYPADFKYPEPFVPHVPHTAPPPALCVPVEALITKDLDRKLEPTLPEPQFKPLHPGRKANLLWSHRSHILSFLKPPLPWEILCELETKATAKPLTPASAEARQTGGPLWHDLYDLEDDDLAHLHPFCKHRPPTKLKRKPVDLTTVTPFSAPPSPFATRTLLQFVDPDVKLTGPRERRVIPAFKLPRWKRRLYMRLLQEVPFISPRPTAKTLWNKIDYTIGRSAYAVGENWPLLNTSDVGPIEDKKRKKK